MRSGSTSVRLNASPDFLSSSTRIPVPGWGFDDFALWWESGGDQLLPAVGRALGMVADPIASVPWKVYRDGLEVPVPLWVRDPQNAQRDGRLPTLDATGYSPLPGKAFWLDALYATVLHGNALIYAPNRDTAGYPLAPMFRIPSGTFRLVPNPQDMLNGSCWCDVCDLLHAQGTPNAPRWEIGGIRAHLRLEDVIHLRGKPPYTRHGMGVGVLEKYAKAFRLGELLAGYSASTFNTGVPTGYLKVGTAASVEQLQKLKRDWLDAQNSRNGRTIAVLGQMVDFTPITINPTDADLVKVGDLVLRDIAHAFGLSAYDLDVQGTSNTYANVQDKQLQRRQDSLLSWATLIEAALEVHLPAGTDMKIALDGLERGTTSQRYDNHTKALAAGFLTMDEVREMEDRPPLGGVTP